MTENNKERSGFEHKNIEEIKNIFGQKEIQQ